VLGTGLLVALWIGLFALSDGVTISGGVLSPLELNLVFTIPNWDVRFLVFEVRAGILGGLAGSPGATLYTDGGGGYNSERGGQGRRYVGGYLGGRDPDLDWVNGSGEGFISSNVNSFLGPVLNDPPKVAGDQPSREDDFCIISSLSSLSATGGGSVSDMLSAV
jgi:hypothetical protein